MADPKLFSQDMFKIISRYFDPESFRLWEPYVKFFS